MTVPNFVAAGTGVAIETGTSAVSKDTCTAGNLVLLHYLVRNGTDDVTRSSVSNITNLIGGNNSINPILVNRDVGTGGTNNKHSFCAGRVTSNGTCSLNLSVGASGGDVFARIYEFAGAFNGSADDGIGLFENEGAVAQSNGVTSATLSDRAVTTAHGDCLGVSLIAVAANQALANFTGETGGDWTEAVAEFASGVGATGTLQIQTASLPSIGTIDGGSQSITSADWGVISFGIIPAVGPVGATISRMLLLGAG